MATLSQLRDRLNSMIAEQGEDAPCAYWIYSKEDAYVMDENNNPEYLYDKGGIDAEAVVNALDEVQEVDHIYSVIQECLDEIVEEQMMLKLQEEDIQDGLDNVVNKFLTTL
jgi:hypothetical protein